MARGVQVYVVRNAPGKRSLGLSQALTNLYRGGLLDPKDVVPIQLKTINDLRLITTGVTEEELLAELGNFN